MRADKLLHPRNVASLLLLASVSFLTACPLLEVAPEDEPVKGVEGTWFGIAMDIDPADAQAPPTHGFPYFIVDENITIMSVRVTFPNPFDGGLLAKWVIKNNANGTVSTRSQGGLYVYNHDQKDLWMNVLQKTTWGKVDDSACRFVDFTCTAALLTLDQWLVVKGQLTRVRIRLRR